MANLMVAAFRPSALLLALAVLAAGCGGSGPPQPPQARPSEAPSPPAPVDETTPSIVATIITVPSGDTAQASPVPTARATPTPLALVRQPIIDMHFHPDPDWDLEALVSLMDELGVRQAVGGSGDEAGTALQFAQMYPDRFVPYAGQDALRDFYRASGSASLNLDDAETLTYLELLEASLEMGCWQGIGEIFVNTLSSHTAGGLRVPADSAVMQQLWDLSATYGVPLSVHMDAEPVSVAEMERLLVSNRDGVWIWAHAGWFAEPAMLRDLLERHPNLYIELSFRDELRSWFPVTSNLILTPEWKDILESRPQRFLLGSDVLRPTLDEYRELIEYWRYILLQLTQETAASFAHRNAEALLEPPSGVDMEACSVTAG